MHELKLNNKINDSKYNVNERYQRYYKLSNDVILMYFIDLILGHIEDPIKIFKTLGQTFKNRDRLGKPLWKKV